MLLHAGSAKTFMHTSPIGVENGEIGGNYPYLKINNWDIGDQAFRAYFYNPSTNQRITITDQIWTHGVLDIQDGFAYGDYAWCVYNSSGQGLVKLVKESNVLFSIYYWTGSAWALVGQQAGGGSFTYDVRMKIHATQGRVELYVNQQYVASVTGINTSVWSEFAEQRWKRVVNDSYQHTHIIATENTIGWTLKYASITANGANTAWTGSYSDINEHGEPNDTNQLATNTVGAKSTFAHENVSATASGSVVKAVIIGARIRNDGSETNAQNVRPMMHKVSTNTDYVHDHALFLPYSGYDARISIYETDPATGLPWTDAVAFNDYEIGFQATDIDGNIA